MFVFCTLCEEHRALQGRVLTPSRSQISKNKWSGRQCNGMRGRGRAKSTLPFQTTAKAWLSCRAHRVLGRNPSPVQLSSTASANSECVEASRRRRSVATGVGRAKRIAHGRSIASGAECGRSDVHLRGGRRPHLQLKKMITLAADTDGQGWVEFPFRVAVSGRFNPSIPLLFRLFWFGRRKQGWSLFNTSSVLNVNHIVNLEKLSSIEL